MPSTYFALVIIYQAQKADGVYRALLQDWQNIAAGSISDLAAWYVSFLYFHHNPTHIFNDESFYYLTTVDIATSWH